MRPVLRFLSDELLARIITEARGVLRNLGVEMHNDGVVAMLSDHGAKIDAENGRVLLTDAVVDRALAAAPRSFKLYDTFGEQTHDLTGYKRMLPMKWHAMKFPE